LPASSYMTEGGVYFDGDRDIQADYPTWPTSASFTRPVAFGVASWRACMTSAGSLRKLLAVRGR